MKNILVLLAISFLLCGNVFAERGIKVFSKSEKRYALIIGNGDYKTGPLRNPVNDANDMARVLRKKGFEVTTLTDANQRQMEKAIKVFGKVLRRGGVGLFFYAGHGMQVKGINYLIPVDAEIEDEDDIRFESVDANRILAKMESAGNRLNMVFLDACRDNPFARSFRSSARGLANMDSPTGTMLSFATAPGKTAADGTGRNGLFTSRLIKYIDSPGLELTQMMKRVRREVRKNSDGKQVPWDVSSLEGDFYFSGANGRVVKEEEPQYVASVSPTYSPPKASKSSNTKKYYSDSENYEVTDVRFFEGGAKAPKSSDRVYKKYFDKSKSKYIYTEMKINNLQYKNKFHKHEVIWFYYNPNGTLRGRIQGDFKVKSKWATSWIYRGWGWAKPGSWPYGTYRVRLLIDGNVVTEKEFTIQ